MEEDPLEICSLEEIENIPEEPVGVYANVQKYLIDYVTTVLEPVFRETAHLDSKYKRALSFSAHVTTAVFTGATLYIYDRNSTGQNITLHDVKLLCTAITLHDINKYWNETTGSNYSGNYHELIKKYFESDPFSLKIYFPEWKNELEEIYFLVQHTQEYDSAQQETRFSRPKYGKLLPYIKIGDKIASLSKMEYPLQEIHKRLSDQGFHVQLLSLPQIPQQLLSQNVYRGVKRLLVESEGIPLVISPQGILYLSENQIFIDKNKLKRIISSELVKNADSEPVLTDRKFDLGPLLSLPLDKDTQFEIYLTTVKNRTEKGLLKELGKTIYPESRILQESTAILTYFIYNDKGSKWTEFPKLKKFIKDEDLKKEISKVGLLRDNFANTDGVGGQKCKAYTVHELVKRQIDYENILQKLHCSLKEALYAAMNTDSKVLDSLIQLICTFNNEACMGLIEEFLPNGNAETCFMCGEISTKEYKPGKHFLQSGGFTKRVTYKDQYKRYCDKCQIEHQLINHLVETSGFRKDEHLLFFYFYFDSIFFNVDPFYKQMNNVDITVHGTGSEKLTVDFSLGNFDTPFHIIPMAIRLPKGSDNSSRSTRRARAIHTAIKACLESGCKCVLTSPYTILRTYNEVFYNEQPSTLEKNLGMDYVRYYRDAKLLDKRLALINKMDGMKGLHRIQQFKRITVVPYIKRQTENFESWTQKNGNFLNDLFGDTYMDMNEVAKKGVALFGKHRFTGTYKKVKIFRTSIDSLIVSKSNGYSDEESISFAAAAVSKDVKREQYSPKKGKDIENESLEFVSSIVDYLKEHELWSVKKLAKWQNPLTDLYEFEYILATK